MSFGFRCKAGAILEFSWYVDPALQRVSHEPSDVQSCAYLMDTRAPWFI
jgi:hypothetical protein